MTPAGSLTTAGEKAGIVAVGGKAYFNAPTSFWRANGVPAGAAPLFGNRWVIMPKADADRFAGDASIKKFADEIRHPTDGAIQPQVNLGQEAGQPVVILSQPSGSTLSVAATGQPYPLHETHKGTQLT